MYKICTTYLMIHSPRSDDLLFFFSSVSFPFLALSFLNHFIRWSSPDERVNCCWLFSMNLESPLGWLTTIAWISNVTTAGYITAITTQGLISLNQPDYVFQRFHGTLLAFAFILIAVFVNIRLISHLPSLERAMFILHVLGFFALLISLVYLAPHRSASDVFTIFLNKGGWPNQSVSFCVGLLGSIGAFVGKSWMGLRI